MPSSSRSGPVRPRTAAALFVLLGLPFAALPFLPPPTLAPIGWGAWLGRFHPLVVHFPIVLVLLPVGLELAGRWTDRDALRRPVLALWTLAVLSAMASAGAGFLLYASGEYAGELVRRHLWGGALTVVFSLAAALLYAVGLDSTRRRTAYRTLLGATAVVLVGTGHLGGTLTHGETFLTDVMPAFGGDAPATVVKPPEELLVFEDLLVPAFEARCLSCHNRHRAKGGFVMTSLETMQAGGDSGAEAFVANDPEASELYRRVTLPPGDDDRMPPSGKPALSADEVALLHWWIASGADPEQQLGNGPEDPRVQAAVRRYLPRLAVAQRRHFATKQERLALADELREKADGWGLDITFDPESDSTLFVVAMRFPPDVVTDETVAELLPYADVFSRVSLAGSDVTDDALYHLAQMPELQALLLPRTAVTGEGLVYLQGHPRLEVLNLAHTAVDDVHALHLMELPALREVYLFGSEVRPNLIDALRAHTPPDVEVLLTEGPYY